jgi:hypothetical protein
MRKRRRMSDMFGSRALYNLHGLERNTMKTAYHAGWRRYIDAYSGGQYHTRISEGFRALGVDNEIWKAHNYQGHLVNKEFRKIEP